MNDTPIVYPITRISKARTDTTRYLSLFCPTLVLDSFLLFHFSVFFSFLWAFVQSFEIQPLYIAVYTSFVRPLSKLYTSIYDYTPQGMQPLFIHTLPCHTSPPQSFPLNRFSQVAWSPFSLLIFFPVSLRTSRLLRDSLHDFLEGSMLKYTWF